MDEENDVAEQQETKEECEETQPDYENTDTAANVENNLDDDYDDDNNNDNNVVENENDEVANASDADECYDDDDVEENFEERDNLENNNSMSDELFSKVLSELITLKSRTEVKKNQSKVIPCAKHFLSLNMSERSKKMTKNVRKNLLHICDYVHQGKFPMINISNDNLRFLRHLLDKRTPKEDVDVGLTEDLRTHAVIREVIDLIEKNGDGARKKPRTR